MLHIQNVSMPRSGHHLLHRILLGTYGEEFGYCEYYKPFEFNSYEPCCKSIPCKKASGFEVFMQKNHDFHHDYPRHSTGAYVVQIRHPVPRVISNFYLFCHNRPAQWSEKGFRSFCDQEAEYYVRFWNDWIGNPMPNSFILKYEKLTKNPYESLREMLNYFGKNVDERRLTETIETEKDFRNVAKVKYRSKSPRDFDFFNESYMQEYVDRLSEDCDGFDYPGTTGEVPV